MSSMGQEPMVDGKPLSELKVVELKKELEKHGLSKAGVKNILYDRLKQFLLSSGGGGASGGAGASAGGGDEHDSSADDALSSTSNPLVAEYLAKQQKQLQEARKDAERVRAESSPEKQGDIDSPRRRSSRQVKESEKVVATSEETMMEEGDSVQESREPVHTLSQREPSGASDVGRAMEVEGEGGSASREGGAIGDEHRSESTSTTSDQEEGDDLEKLRESARRTMSEERRKSAKDGEMEGDDEESESRPAQGGERRRRWGGGTRLTKKPPVAVTVDADSLQHLMAEAEDTASPHEELDYGDDDEGENQHGQETMRLVQERRSPGQEDETEMETRPARTVVAEDSSTMDEEDEFGLVRVGGPPSPPRYPPDCHLHIRCLTRPFTVKTLQQLLARFGTIDVSRFWIDHIKSNCIVKFATIAEAELARSRLHNAKWPLSNPKSLRVDFANEQVLERHIERESNTEKTDKPAAGDSQQRVVLLVDEKAPPPTTTTTRLRRSPSPERARKRKRSESPPPKANPEHTAKRAVNEREWDRGKQRVTGLDRTSPGRGRRSPGSPAHHPRNGGGTTTEKEPAPRKLLDELFRKTKATPCIYWLPLTEQQIANRVAQKLAARDGKTTDSAGSKSQVGGETQRVRRRSTPTPPRRAAVRDR